MSYSVAYNSGTSSRTGTVTIAGQTFTVIQEGSEPSLPNPELVFEGTEEYQPGGQPYIRYLFGVTNRQVYPNEMFEATPDLPPCGLNENAPRTWVRFYSEDGAYIYGFCALSSPEDLDNIWFGLPVGTTPPNAVYITFSRSKRSVEFKNVGWVEERNPAYSQFW